MTSSESEFVIRSTFRIPADSEQEAREEFKRQQASWLPDERWELVRAEDGEVLEVKERDE